MQGDDLKRPAGAESFRVWPAVDADGWCEWQMPIMRGYQMQCCDCGLVHEVEFHIAEWKGEQRVEFRMRRSGPEARAGETSGAGSDLTPAVQTDATEGTSETFVCGAVEEPSMSNEPESCRPAGAVPADVEGLLARAKAYSAWVGKGCCGDCPDDKEDLVADLAAALRGRVVGAAAPPFEQFCRALAADFAWAWSWHCNLAMMAVDAGAPHREANERAADFMERAFGVKVNDSEEFRALTSAAPTPARAMVRFNDTGEVVPESELRRAYEAQGAAPPPVVPQVVQELERRQMECRKLWKSSGPVSAVLVAYDTLVNDAIAALGAAPTDLQAVGLPSSPTQCAPPRSCEGSVPLTQALSALKGLADAAARCTAFTDTKDGSLALRVAEETITKLETMP